MTSIPPRPRTVTDEQLAEALAHRFRALGPPLDTWTDEMYRREARALLDRHAEAAAIPAQDSRPLDVERLARALSETWGGTPPNWQVDGRTAPERAQRAFQAEAELVAAAYARLAAEKPHD